MMKNTCDGYDMFNGMISANISNKLSACMLFSNSMTFVFDGMDLQWIN